jgi:hypothetical protein
MAPEWAGAHMGITCPSRGRLRPPNTCGPHRLALHSLAMRTLRLSLFALAPFALVVAACGGSTGSPLTGDAGSQADTGTTHPSHDSGHDSGHTTRHDAATQDAPAATHDSGTHHDAVALDSAPPPDSSTGPDAVALDSGSPVDSSTPIDSAIPHDTGSPQDSGGNSPTCPASVPTGNCSQPNLSCDYPPAGSNSEGSACICTNGDPPTSMTTWHCTSLAAGCPTQQPTLGTACTQAGLVCDYGACMGGEKVECTNNKWKEDMTGGCPG